MSDFNTTIVDEFRANNGTVQTMGFGRSLVLVHSIGAKSGAQRTIPLAGIPVDDGWLIAASAAGAPTNPAWYYNLLAHPKIEIDYPTADGIDSTTVSAVDLTGAERDAAWQKFVDRSPMFADYQVKAGDRTIPVFLLRRG